MDCAPVATPGRSLGITFAPVATPSRSLGITYDPVATPWCSLPIDCDPVATPSYAETPALALVATPLALVRGHRRPGRDPTRETRQ